MAARDSKEYWADRAAKREKRASTKADVLAKKLKREYTRAAKEIRQKLDAFYGRYATERGLSYAETIKKLNSREAREWKKTLGEYVDEINAMPEGKAKDKLIAELDARSYASQQDRLSSLSGQIDMEVDRLFATSEEQMTLTMSDVLEDGYYSKGFDLQQRAGVLSPFARLSTKMVEDALTYPWSGTDFSSRIWENKRALLFQARQSITQGLIQGKSVAAMSKDLADALGKSYTVAERLIRTETNHFHNEADKLAYTAAGVKEYEFMASLSERTCPVCGGLDGRHFPLSEAKAGVNYPPVHPHCRCTTVEYDPEDAEDWATSGQPMPKTMTYQEWLDSQEKISQSADGKASGGISKMEKIGRIKPDTKSIDKMLGGYEKKWTGLDHEEAVVITADGDIFHAVGDSSSVNTSGLGDKLRGAVDFHNHPDDKTYYSFSAQDVGYFLQMGQKESRAADSTYRYYMRRTSQTVDAQSEEVIHRFREVRETEVRELAWYGKINIDVDEYHETVLRLAQEYHFEYERVKRNVD